MQQIFLFLTLPVSFQMVQCARSDSTAHDNLRVFAGSACQCWMPFGLMRHRGLKRAPSVPLLSRSSAHLSASDCAVALVLPHPRSQWQV